MPENSNDASFTPLTQDRPPADKVNVTVRNLVILAAAGSAFGWLGSWAYSALYARPAAPAATVAYAGCALDGDHADHSHHAPAARPTAPAPVPGVDMGDVPVTRDNIQTLE